MSLRLGDEILNRIMQSVKLDVSEFVSARYRDPFLIIVATILSQNTSDRNSIKAMQNMERLGLTNPQAIMASPPGELEKAIRVSGMYRQKARTIRDLARHIMTNYGGDIGPMISKGWKDVREELMSIKGIGEKTADVFLLFYMNAPVFPVDTHIKRIASRLGIAHGDYKKVSHELLEIFFNKRLEAHLYLIAFGRSYCRARSPLCSRCPLLDMCDYGKTFVKQR